MKPLPLSLSQREVWLDQSAWPGSAHLNIGGAGLVTGPLDVARLRRALALLVQRYDALRLVPMADGTQQLLEALEPPWREFDFSAEPDPRDAMQRWCQQRMTEPFEFGAEPPWYLALLRGGAGLHTIFVKFHHLIMDGWGTVQLIRHLARLYGELSDGVAAPGPPVAMPLSYLEFVRESQAYLESDSHQHDACFWRQQLPALPPPLLERRHALHVPGQLPDALLATIPIPRPDYQALVLQAQACGLTAFHHFLAALAWYFGRINRIQEVVIGVPTLNRGGRKYLDLPGMFVGVLALRIELREGMSGRELLQAVAVAMHGALRHPRYPLSELARELQVMRSGRSGLLDVILSFERQDYTVSFGEARSGEIRQFFSGQARYPLGVTVCEFNPSQDLELVLEGSSDCFGPDEPRWLGERLWHLVQRLQFEPERTLDQIALLPPKERTHILQRLQPGGVGLTAPESFVAAFERQARERPDAIALVWPQGSLSYAELDQAADGLALRLHEAGAGPERIVALALERSPELVLAIIATGKAGAAFLPLDVDAPSERLGMILAESGALMLLTQPDLLEHLGGLHEQVMAVDHATWLRQPVVVARDPLTPRCGPAVSDLAYVLYTSGSTGRPKGVMVEHASLARRLAWLSRTWEIRASDCAGQQTQATFDPALIELLLPLVNGARVALPPPGRLAPESLARWFVAQGVTFSAFVPSTLARFVEGARGVPGLRLRVACCGGEVLAPELAARFMRETGARLFNVYGPTEAVIFATAWPCVGRHGGAPLPIGQPIDEVRVYVLDEGLNTQPLGVAGEICIGGDALARGYLKRPELDAMAFLPDPFRGDGRMYRTGDRGWWGGDGQLHFAGRLDRQVKLRGYRVELGEIEAVALDCAGVVQAAVKLVNHEGQPRLYLWLGMPTGGEAESVGAALRSRLPDYMWPAGLLVQAHLPESATGKVAYDRLPEPVWTLPRVQRGATGEIERKLLDLWRHELACESIGVQDNFFDLGGDSLAAVNMLMDVERWLGRRVHLYELLENPTVETLATALERTAVPRGVLTALHDAGPLLPGGWSIYLAASGYGDLLRFHALAQALGPGVRVWMLQPPDQRPDADLTELARAYASAVSLQGQGGRVCLMGFSVGGLAALETAKELAAQGQAPQALVLLDTIYPRPMWRTSRMWRLMSAIVAGLHLQDLTLNGRRLGALFADAALVGQVMALQSYHPVAFQGPTLLLKTRGLVGWDRWLFSPWRRLFAAGRWDEREVAGMHGSLFEAQHVDQVAEVLQQWLSTLGPASREPR